MYKSCTAYSKGMQELPLGPPRRGRPRTLEPERVVAAALELVDESGPEGLSVRGVAGRLGVQPNAVYTYVASRAALEQAIVEQVLAEADSSSLADEDPWPERIVAYAVSLRQVLLRHPGVARVMMTAPMNGPNALLVGERLMGALRTGGLTAEDAARTAYALIVQVLGAVALEVAETDGRPPLPPEAERIAERRAGLDGLDAAKWPLTAATRDVAAQWISTDQFVWSVRRLLR